MPRTVSNRVLKAVWPGACAPGSGIAPWSRADAGDPRRRRDAIERAASLYHYFAGRHRVGAELVQRHLTEVDARLTAALNNPKRLCDADQLRLRSSSRRNTPDDVSQGYQACVTASTFER